MSHSCQPVQPSHSSHFQIKDGKLHLCSDTTLEHEVACIDVTPFNDGSVASEIVSIGLWTDISVRLLKLPTLEEIAKEPLGGGQHD